MSIARYGKGTRRTQSATVVSPITVNLPWAPAPNGGHGGFEGDNTRVDHNDGGGPDPQPLYSYSVGSTWYNSYDMKSANTAAFHTSGPLSTNSTAQNVVDNRDSDSSNNSKSIVCTEMYRQTQLPDWSKAMKTWDIYQKKYLTPTHEIGYHWLFRPYVRGMQKNNTLTKLGAYLATERTQHLRHILTKGKAKDSLVGKVWCSIIHPVVYAAGKIKVLQNKIEIMRIKNYGN